MWRTRTGERLKFVKIDPPGTWCQNDAILNLVRSTGAKSFVEVGCGAGDLSHRLCMDGLSGFGIDFSPRAIEIAGARLKNYVDIGKYTLIADDALAVNFTPPERPDLGISVMVMEHIEDDISFIRKLIGHVKPGGFVILGVPGRRDRWNIEDETVGHVRRYDRQDLIKKMNDAGLTEVNVISVAVPTANLLFYVGNLLIKKSSEVKKKSLSQRLQTEDSGIREIPFKTVFPAFFRLLLNRFSMLPLIYLQRMFFNTDLGLTILGVGRVPK